MNRILIVLALVVAGVIGLGFYQKWFNVASNSAEGQSHITLTVDKDKMRTDEHKAVEKMESMEHAVKEKTMGAAKKSKGESAAPAESTQDQK